MSVNIIKTYDPSAKRDIELAVQQQNLTVTVKAGNFKEKGVQYVLADDYTYDLPATKNRTVCGYLVKDSANNTAHVLVDDAATGDEINWSVVPQYELLHHLFCFVAPAHLPTLDDVQILVFHVLPDQPQRSE